MTLSKKLRIILAVIIFLSLLISLAVLNLPALISAYPAGKSTADVSLGTSSLKIAFDLTKSDRSKLNKIASKLGISAEFAEGVEIGLDEKNTEQFKKLLPAKVYLDIEESGIKFQSESRSNLKSVLSDSTYDFATGSAKAKLKMNSDTDFTFEVENPRDALEAATSSGQMRISQRLEGIFPILEKVSTIKLRVQGKFVEGEINFK